MLIVNFSRVKKYLLLDLLFYQIRFCNMDRKKIEENFLFETSLVPVAYLNNEGILIKVNQAYLDFYDFKKDEILGKSFLIHFEHLSEETKKKVFNTYKSNFKKGQTITYEVIVMDKKENLKTIFLKHNFVNTFEEYYSMIQFYESYGRLNQIQKENYELRQLVSEKDEYLNSIAHEIISPAGAIKSLIQILDEKEETIKNKHYFRLIKISIDYIINLGNNLLEAMNMDYLGHHKKEKFELNEMLIELVKNFEGVCFKKNIDLIFESKQKFIHYFGNKMGFQLALSNLISNSIKFSNTNSKVILGLREEDSKIIISIKDFGIGIDEETMKNIFIKIKKSRKTGTHGEKSTGLGLYLVKKILDFHEAEIQVNSVLNEGTEIQIFLNIET